MTLLSMPGCHLCDALKQVAAPVLDQLGLKLEERDVRQDVETERRYGLAIPVLLWRDPGGKPVEVLRHRTTPEALRARLEELGLAPPA